MNQHKAGVRRDGSLRNGTSPLFFPRNLGIALRRVGRQAEAVWAIREFLRLLENVPYNRVWFDRARTMLVELGEER